MLLALAFALLLGAFALGGAGRLGRGRRLGSRAARLTFLGVLLRLGQIGQTQVAGPWDLALGGAGRWQRGRIGWGAAHPGGRRRRRFGGAVRRHLHFWLGQLEADDFFATRLNLQSNARLEAGLSQGVQMG